MKQNRNIFWAVMLVTFMSLNSAAFADSYTVTIPSKLTVQNSGWNALGSLSATGDIGNKELLITASSTQGFNLVHASDSNAKVPYVIMDKSSGDGKSYANVKSSGQTEWKFSNLSSTAQSMDLGIVVDDYSRAKHGSYSSTVTFSAGLQNPLTILKYYPVTKGTKLKFTLSYIGAVGDAVVFEYDGSAFNAVGYWAKGSTLTLSNNVYTANVTYNTGLRGTVKFKAELKDGSNPSLTVSNFSNEGGTIVSIKVGLIYEKPDGTGIEFFELQDVK